MARPLALVRTLATAAMLLAGCASIPEDQCAKTDWYALGQKDGRAGLAVERLTEHREACAGVKVEPDELRYLQGRKVGLAEYCQPDNAFREGAAGNTYSGVCDAAYARNWRAAYNVATLKKQIEANRSAISWREAEIRGDKASDSRRANLRNEVRDLDRRRESMRNDLVVAERELDRTHAAAVVAPAPTPPAAAPLPPAAPASRAVAVGKPGTATGSMRAGNAFAPLRFAYVFVAPDPLDGLKQRPMLLLTGQAIADDDLAHAQDLDAVLGRLPHYVLAIRNDAKPPKTALIAWHPQLATTPVVQTEVQASGTLKFDAYGPARITGNLASPQSGKSPYAWNKNLRLTVRFDAPLTRRWPP